MAGRDRRTSRSVLPLQKPAFADRPLPNFLAWRASKVARLGLIGATLAVVAGGCVRRELTIESDPPGALVFLNDQEVGRTPVTRSFTFYGTYDVVLRLEGYETLRTQKLVLAPWWQWVPLDLFAELLPLTDRQTARFVLKPEAPPGSESPQAMLDRAEELRKLLPATQPATRPADGSAGVR